MPRISQARDLETLQQHFVAKRERVKTTIVVCGGTGCQASRSGSVIDAVRAELARQGLMQDVVVRVTGCHGFCEQGPIMVFEPGNLFYCHVTPNDAQDIVSRTVKKGEVIDKFLYTDPVSGGKVTKEAEIPFYSAQGRQLLNFNKLVDACSIDDYIAIGGYRAIARTLKEFKPAAIISEIKASGLRGRGGAGFHTGRKWEEALEAPGDEKYVICNADEGDPGAYMDRCLLEANPHQVLEGMMIGARAVGARKGYIYVRREYPLAVKHVRIAVQQARE